MNKKRIIIILGIIAFVGLLMLYDNWTAIQTESVIRRKMLKKFPVGTKKEIVWNYAKQTDSKWASARKTGWWLNNDQSSDIEIGVSHIECSVCHFPPVDVTVIWIFDDQDKLIEIYAWKTIDFL